MESAPENEFVLVACKSGYVTTPWIFRVAQFTEGYHDRWDNEANDALMDNGDVPEFWTELPDPPTVASSDCDRFRQEAINVIDEWDGHDTEELFESILSKLHPGKVVDNG